MCKYFWQKYLRIPIDESVGMCRYFGKNRSTLNATFDEIPAHTYHIHTSVFFFYCNQIINSPRCTRRWCRHLSSGSCGHRARQSRFNRRRLPWRRRFNRWLLPWRRRWDPISLCWCSLIGFPWAWTSEKCKSSNVNFSLFLQVVIRWSSKLNRGIGQHGAPSLCTLGRRLHSILHTNNVRNIHTFNVHRIENQGQNQYFPLFRSFVFRLFCLGSRV